MASLATGRAKTAAQAGKGIEIFKLPPPKPPAELDETERAEWREIVSTMPSTHFPRDTHPLLVGYVRKSIRLREVGELIARAKKAEPFDVGAYLELCRAETETCKILAVLATKMRLAQQCYQDREVKRPETVRRPWDED